MTEAEIGAWAVWHPTEGFGSTVYVSKNMDLAVIDRNDKRALDGDDRWKVVPVRVVRVDHT